MLQYQDAYLTLFESALYRTTTTLFHNEDLVLLVDPNWLPQEIEQIRAKVNQVQGNRTLYLLFTHSDYDHIIAWKAFPEAKTIASKAFVENPKKDKCLEEIIEFDEMYYIQRNYPIAYPEVDIVIEHDGQSIQLGASQLTFYLAPGHNADGIYTIIEPAGIWLAGDYLSNIEFPFIYHDSRAYEDTLNKTERILNKHTIQMLIPGHGDYTKSIEEIKKRKQEGLDYILRLRSAIKEGRPFQEDLLWQRYRFKRGMRGFHDENIKLINRELGE